MLQRKKPWACGALIMGLLLPVSLPAAQPLSLQEAVASALDSDEWITRSRELQKAAESEALSAGSLPDPVLSLGVNNLPADTWDLDQENMTQVALSVTQSFPRGKSRRIKKEQWRLQAALQPVLRQERQAAVVLKVTTHWLNAYRAAKTTQLIEQQRDLFEQLVALTASRYRAAVGQARQQDVIRAELALTRLDDRSSRLQLDYERHRGLLLEWLPRLQAERELMLSLPPELPEMPVFQQAEELEQHPRLVASRLQAAIRHEDEQLARQAYKPGWSLKAAYAHRQDAPNGMERSDLVSLGVMFDLPVFTRNRQDPKLVAAQARATASERDTRLIGKRMWAQYQEAQARVRNARDRVELYRQHLLPQTREQADVELQAYTHDDGDITDVIQAYIADLNARIEAIELEVTLRQAQAELRYLHTRVNPSAKSFSEEEPLS